jgi:putative endonuclease
VVTKVEKIKKGGDDHHKKRRRLGQRGEEAACEFLLKHKMKIIERNWRCSYGEADIIALDGNTLVFCEVKTRSNLKFGKPEDSITRKKLERYYKLIKLYRSRNAIRHSSVRLDFIGISVDEENRKAKLQYLRDVYANH